MLQPVRSYYLEHKTIFEENFNIVLQSFDMEAIHKMRTTTKRLRALFQLIQFLSPEQFKAKKQLKNVRQVFKHAGKIREVQIEQELLILHKNLSDDSFEAYIEYLKQREHREISAFLKSIPAVSKRGKILDDEKILSTIDSIPENTKNEAQRFIDWKAGQIHKLNNLPVSDHRIHRNRTYIKQLYYLFDILTYLTGQDKILNKNSEQLRDIEQLIGSWHDLINSTQYLQSFFNAIKGEKTAEYLAYKKIITAEKNSKQDEIINILKSL
ncbi:MAG: CHAD domain-containing protein [Bacteroidales bacterium]|nr:CHAD domain-containing protein [Bacteroidales bacterium]